MGRIEHYYVCADFYVYFSVFLSSLLDVTLYAVTCNKIDCPNEWIFYLLVYTTHTHTQNKQYSAETDVSVLTTESCEKNNSQSIMMTKKKEYTMCDAKTWVTFVRIVCENAFDIHYYVLQHFLVFNAIQNKNVT